VIDDAAARGLAQELHRARADAKTVPQLSLRFPEMDVADAYAVQRCGAALVVAEGRRIVGRKIGLTSKAMQRSMGIEVPDYGFLSDDMLFEDGADVPAARFIFPRVELELAFMMGKRLTGPGVGVGEVMNATSYLAPALEILDSRIEMVDVSGHRRTIVDTIADNAADAGVVVGRSRIDPAGFRPRAVGGELWVNGIIEDTGLATAVLGDPARGVAWLADQLATYGESLEEGQLVLSGSFIQSLPVSAGDSVTADFAELGSVSCRFV
jgi:2-oxo-hept-3-ene-1,7-dioate hydratase